MVKTLLSIFMVCSLISANVYAGDVVVPEGRDYEVGGEKGIFFTLEEYKQVGVAYVQLNKFLKQEVLLDAKFKLNLDIERSYDLRIENCQSHIEVVEYDVRFQKAQVEDLKKRLKATIKVNKIERISHWILHGVLAGTTLFLAIKR